MRFRKLYSAVVNGFAKLSLKAYFFVAIFISSLYPAPRSRVMHTQLLAYQANGQPLRSQRLSLRHQLGCEF